MTNVTGEHDSNRTNADVGALAISTYSLEYGVPRSVEDFFPDLVVLSLSDVGIYSFSSENIAPFPQLKVLVLYNNDLEYLDADTFAHNPAIEYINLSSNRLRHLGSNIFNPLPNLQVLRLKYNWCIDENYDSEETSVFEFTWRATSSCPPSFDQLESEIVNGRSFQEVVNPLVERIEQLERSLAALKNAN